MSKPHNYKTNQEIQVLSNKHFGNYIFKGRDDLDSKKGVFECEIHGEINVQLIQSHISEKTPKHCCSKCIKLKKRNTRNKTKEEIQLISDSIFSGAFYYQGRDLKNNRKGVFWCKNHKIASTQELSSHFKGFNPCPMCNGRNQDIKSIRKSINELFDNKYFVIEKLKYGNIKLKCNIHNSEYILNYYSAIKRKNCGCKECSVNHNRRLSIEEYQKRIDLNPALKNRYLISEIIYGVDNGPSKAKIICLKHQEQEIIQNTSSVGRFKPSCSKCVDERLNRRKGDDYYNRIVLDVFRQKYKEDKLINYADNLFKRKKIKGHSKVFVSLVCQEHKKPYEICLSDFKKGRTGCELCRVEKIRKSKLKYSYEDFVIKGGKINHNRYLYPKQPLEGFPFVNGKSPLVVYCKNSKHGKFTTNYYNHIINQSGHCPKCVGWKNEKRIRLFLEKLKLKFSEQYFFEDCLGDRRFLLFDFFVELPCGSKLIIEFDGIQHFKLVKGRFGDVTDFRRRVRYDRKKNSYAKENDINILRIHYKQESEIEEVIKDVLNSIRKGERVYITNEEMVNKI